MRRRKSGYMGCAVVLLFVVLLGGCAIDPYYGSSYEVMENPPVTEGGSGQPSLGPDDRTYVLDIDDRTPFGLTSLPLAMDTLYNRGYDEVRREREADFAIDMFFQAGSRDNPDLRAGQALGGALTGAALGAIIGGATGDPGPGAAIGAAGGGFLGAVAPASTGMVRIDIQIHSFRENSTSSMSATVDLASVPPYDVMRVVDTQVSRMLRRLPRR